MRAWKIKLNKFNHSSINSFVQSSTVEAQTFNSHVIKSILNSDWLRGTENYSNRVRVHVWNRTNRTNRTNLRLFCSEDGLFVQTIHNLGANGPGILLAIVSMVEYCNVNDWFKKEKMSLSTSTVYCAKMFFFIYFFFTLIWHHQKRALLILSNYKQYLHIILGSKYSCSFYWLDKIMLRYCW